MKKLTLPSLICLTILNFGCVTTANDNQGHNNSTLTAGLVQSEIRKGMPGSDVAASLGSPNIVSSDANGNQVWIYDKISSSVSQSNSSAYGTLLLIGGSKQNSSRQSSQSTFTVVIKFDQNNLVRDFAYHSSKF